MTSRFQRIRPWRLLPILPVLLSLLLPSESSAFVRRDLPPSASFDIAITNALLAPTADYPLVIRSRPENRVELTGAIRVEGPDHVRLQGLFLDPAAGKTVRLVSTSGSGLGACVVKATVTATNCTDLKIVGNTFDYRTGAARLEILGGSGSLLRNNVILNDGTTNGLYVSGTSPNSDYNCYYPSNTPAEAHSVYSDPMLSPTDYTVTNLASPVVAAGQAVSGFDVDLSGYSRDPATPCIGAVEVLFDDIGEAPHSRGADGRLARRRVGRWVIDYTHDGLGRLTACSACDGTVTNTGSYAYDPFTRRIGMTLVRGGVTNVYRFVYDGPDVVAEFVDVDGDGVADRKRVYWLTEEIDQRIGFADITAGGVSFYYYLVDQVGTVQQIVDESGTVVNQYEYDAWGNVHWNSSNTIERVENRYLFHGREWDPIGLHYSFRFRSMLPDQHIFDGSDMNLAAGIYRETEGFGSAAFCRNVPVDPDMKDPWGDWNIWNVATWGVANGVGYKWYDSLNPAHESTGFKGSVKGAVGGATIYANDPTQGVLRLDVRGTAVAWIEVTPERLDFGNAGTATTEARDATISWRLGTGFSVTNVRSTARQFHAETNSPPPGKACRITVTTVPPLPPGVTQASVVALTDDPDYPAIEIPVVAAALSDLVVVPSELHAGGPEDQFVALRSRAGRAFRIVGVDTPDPEMKPVVTPMGAHGYRIRLSLPRTPGAGEVRIHTDLPGAEEVVIPIKAAR